MDFYVVTDAEFDGPTPGRNSMLSFASVAVGGNGAVLGEFDAVLQPLAEASPDPYTLAWFKSHPEAFAAAMANPEPAGAVMARFVSWVRDLPGEATFAAHPPALDGPWIDFYLQRFTKTRLTDGPWIEGRLFHTAGLCLRSFAAGRLGWPLSRCHVGNYPAAWLGSHPHSHRAIDDARGYAALLRYLLTKGDR